MSGWTIRPATRADVPAITAIYRSYVLDNTATFEEIPPDLAEMTQRYDNVLAQRLPYLVAVKPGQTGAGERGADIVLGYAYASPYRVRAAYRYTVENSIYLAAGQGGQGIGSALLAELIEGCRSRGLRQMIAAIGGADNVASIRLHRKAGFVDAGRLAVVGYKFNRWLDIILMQRTLGAGDQTMPDQPGLAL